MFALTFVTVALKVHVCFKHWYFKDKARQNPLKSIIRVISFSATVKRQPPRYRRAFRFGEEKKPRIELAKIEYDGIYPSAEVEDVKTFCRILLVIYALGGYFALYGALYAMVSYQFKIAATPLLSGQSQVFLPPIIMSLLDDGFVLLCLPLMNNLILPYFPGFNMRLRAGLGVFVTFLSSIAAMSIQWTAHHLSQEKHILWLLLPSFLLAFGEVLVFVTGLEFIYAQSPESMKGLLTGLFYLGFGVFSGCGNILFYQYPTGDVLGVNIIAWFYFMLSVIGAVSFVMYTIVACLYRNRERPTTDGSEGEAIRRIYAQDVYSHA